MSFKNQFRFTLSLSKLKRSSIVLIITFALSSCSTTKYFQVYKTSAENAISDDNHINFEDANCKVIYDLWSEGGNIGFTIYNKSNADLTINLDKSFFILNGNASDYYQNRVFTKTNNSVIGHSVSAFYWYNFRNSVSSSTSSGYSTAYNEKQNIIIPANSSKHIVEYLINNEYFKSCDLKKFPSRKEISPINFSKSSSPFVFKNTIDYTLNGKSFIISNNFYVSEIVNIPNAEMFQRTKLNDCDKTKTVDYPKFKNANSFYVEYTKDNNSTEKH
ncbi:hypothetical protein ACFPVY_10700 [Flavobacterium qiangtangense]|uniref:Lipoprotein n=1 Tax=Flavobacterium qiangtangense TaxID=1442595 RepID=A0ABW1PPX6_9FLAO